VIHDELMLDGGLALGEEDPALKFDPRSKGAT
jgi:hypothetical protein